MAKLIAAGVLMPGAVACEVLSLDGDRALPMSGKDALAMLGRMETRVKRDHQLCALLEPRGSIRDAIVEDGLSSARVHLCVALEELEYAEAAYRQAFFEHGWETPIDDAEARQMTLIQEMVAGMLERCPVDEIEEGAAA
jgi:hypothetical protein